MKRSPKIKVDKSKLTGKPDNMARNFVAVHSGKMYGGAGGAMKSVKDYSRKPKHFKGWN